ncbi:YLP motif-containing protein 1-like isoform X1 [Diorhabda carinulata]|uniref:YLP motif-containing protein 1-like isoform X1 n=1 Tax=Diorhabda carinulata TaxID=1163345 RepID=UPI0025A1E800|nr:YLP motif-containing protein 1-like isoform X1 [Diorhabda carinulata]
MSWPTWSAAAAPIPTAVAATVPSSLLPTGINSTPTVLAPMGYSQDQWAQAQQQNWQQWAQWQQQYQQWHQQYGAEYQKSLNAMQGTLPTAVQVHPPLPTISAATAPPLPIDNKPPLPPEEPPTQLAGFTAIPPGYATATPAMISQTPVQPLYQVQPTQTSWQSTAQKRPYTQDNDYTDSAKRMMVQKPPPAQWPNYSQPPPSTSTSQAPPQATATQNVPPIQSSTPAKPNVEELSEAEKKFDKEFAAWEAQFNKWREQNANHPDKTQYKEYEKKWESWRNSLLERREQMRRKRLALCGQTTTTVASQKSDTLQQASSNTSQLSSTAKPSLLGTYLGDKSTQHQANDLYNKLPPNQNNEPLSFKNKSPYQDIDNIPEKEGEGFLTSTSSAEGIPGLDLVKDDAKEDLPDRSEKTEEEASTQPKGPDFEAISKGINSILGDQKLLSMLSIVSQNAPPVTHSNCITTESVSNISNYGQNYGVPPPNFQQYPPSYHAPPPMYEGQNTDYSGQEITNKDDYYPQRNDKFSEPPPDMRSSGPRISQDTFNRGVQNVHDIYGGAPSTAQDNFGSGSRHVQDRFGFGARNVQNNFGGRNIQDKIGFGGRNEQENFDGNNVQGNFAASGRNVSDNFGSGTGNIPSFGARNSSFDKGIDRLNRNNHFNDGFQGRNDKFHNERFGNNDVFNNKQNNNFTDRERFNNKYGRSGKFNDNKDYEDYDEYNEEEDYDKYNEMFKDDDNEPYNSNYQHNQQNRFKSLPPQAKIPSLLDITPKPPQRQPQSKIPSLMDMTPEPPQICNDTSMVDDDVIFEPTTVIDYEHCSKADLDHSVTIVPVHMYDYNHKPVNSVPHSERPKWLAETVKFIREFDPSVLRYERPPPIEDRYPASIREEIPYDRYEDRDRYRGRKNRRDRSFERDNRTSNDRKRYRSRDRARDDFENRRKYPVDKFDGIHDTLHIKNVEEISDSEMDFEQNEQGRLNDEMDSRRSRSPELSNPPNPSARQEITMIEDIINAPGRYNRPPRIVIILRGPPGSGKTFLAKQIKDKEVENGGSAPRILSLDDYFMVEHEKQVVEDGKTQIVKEMVYEYEADMEESYRQSFMKSFKKTITDGYFTFIVVDNVNDKVKHFGKMWSFAKQNGFQVYVCQMDLDPVQCTKRNIHNRSEKEIEEIISAWEPTPSHHPTIDATGLLQSSITEVEMELEEEKHSSLEETKDPEDQVRSKWDNFDCSYNNLAKLDGLNKPLRRSGTMEEYLQMESEWEPPKSTKPGKKRVRWADLEEQRNVEKMKAIGFVVGHTDWERIMDPEASRKALTQTKYIENVSRYKY